MRRSGGCASGHQRAGWPSSARNSALRSAWNTNATPNVVTGRPSGLDPGDRIHQRRGRRDGHTGRPGLLEQFPCGGGERILTRIDTPAWSDPDVEQVMIDHQHMGAVVVEHPGPHHQLAETVGGDRLEPGQGVTFDTWCRFGEETQPGRSPTSIGSHDRTRSESALLVMSGTVAR
jgi:hypothetical protein